MKWYYTDEKLREEFEKEFDISLVSGLDELLEIYIKWLEEKVKDYE